MSEDSNRSFTAREALFYHETIRPGKIEIIASKPMTTQRDLSLAYSPVLQSPLKRLRRILPTLRSIPRVPTLSR